MVSSLILLRSLRVYILKQSILVNSGFRNIYLATLRLRKYIAVVVNFLFQLIFIFPLFWCMVMYANEFKTKEKQKLTEIKN